MTSEINNLLRGNVVSTVEFDTNKKIIGVSTANLTPNESGITPLGKQGAFEVKKEEAIETFDIAVNDALNKPVEDTIENIDLPKIGEPKESVGKFIPEPQESDIVLENPVSVDSMSSLSSLSMPKLDEPSEEIKEEVQINEPAFDIQMPEMPGEVVAEAPSGLNDNLFVDTPSDLQNTVAPVEEVETPIISNDVPLEPDPIEPIPEPTHVEFPSLPNEEIIEPAKPEVAPVIDLDSILEEKRKNLVDRINALTEAEINKYSEELKDLFSKNNSQTKTVESEQNDKIDTPDNSLINDALSRIDNMAISNSSSGISM